MKLNLLVLLATWISIFGTSCSLDTKGTEVDAGEESNNESTDDSAVTSTDEPDGTDSDSGSNSDSETDTDIPDPNAIVLPIEVLGGSGTREEVSFELENKEDVDHLYLRCQACGYHIDELDRDAAKVKSQVQINQCPPIDLKAYAGEGKGEWIGNPAVVVIGPEAVAGGLGGGHRVARMKIEIDGECLTEGTNSLAFVHKDADPHQLGFRIIELNLLRKGALDNRVLPSTAFRDDDPTLWEPPLPSDEDVEEGRRLFNQRDIIYDLATDLSDGEGDGAGPNNGMIKAACGDCHAPSARGFAYFNFSNKSIITGAMSHLLSTKQAQQIASFVRSADVPRVRQARPWNPPYQPGPGLDSLPVDEWAAGAGVDAILERDEDTIDFLFPDGTIMAEVEKVVDRYSTLNMRELPTNLSMPHWGAWLPPISPIDAFDLEHEAVLSDEDGNWIGVPFFEYLYENAKKDPSRKNIWHLFERLSKWWKRGATCYSQTLKSGPEYRAMNGVVTQAIVLPHLKLTEGNCENRRYDVEAVKNIELAKRGLAHWIAVRLWEIIHENGLEEEAAKQTQEYCSLGVCITGAEPRGWVTTSRVEDFDVYHLAPHYIGFNSKWFVEKTEFIGRIENNQWYHLQMILNPGYREIQTSHWAYTLVRAYDLALNDVNSVVRLYSTIIKMRQSQTNGEYGDSNGLSLRYAQPFWYFSGENGERTGHKSLPDGLYTKLYEALTWDFLEAVAEGSREDWAEAKNNNDVQPRDSEKFELQELGRQTFPQPGPQQGENTYRLIDITSRDDSGMKPRPSKALQMGLIEWCEDMWPLGPWNKLRNTIDDRY